jgi:hypothetical protein
MITVVVSHVSQSGRLLPYSMTYRTKLHDAKKLRRNVDVHKVVLAPTVELPRSTTVVGVAIQD